MKSRIDISPYLVHFTRGENITDAFENLQSIISSQIILGTNNLIKGGYNCVCFSEAPIDCLTNGLINENYYSKYSPFGIVVKKDWLFSLGGRQVIYQTEQEYFSLLEEQRWRHMTYDPCAEPPIDFTWEREWRIKVDELYINPDDCSIIVLNEDWANSLILMYEYWQDREEDENRLRNYAMFNTNNFISSYNREPFPWRIITLNGID